MIDRIKSVLTKLGFCAKDVDSLSQDIFNTKYYRDNYEYIARANLIKELSKIVPLVD